MSYVNFLDPAMQHAGTAADHDEKKEYDKGMGRTEGPSSCRGMVTRGQHSSVP